MHISQSNGFIEMTTSYISNKTYGVTPLSIDNNTDFSGLDPPYLSANF
ncbi:hypothetical protein WMQ31_19685 [Vibrio alginolyticus]